MELATATRLMCMSWYGVGANTSSTRLKTVHYGQHQP
jgi:hypothetical protein